MQEKEHILDLLKEVKEYFKKEEIVKLKELSDQTLHSASVNQDKISIALAVMVYSLGKILERTNYREYPSWNQFIRNFIRNIDLAREMLERNNEKMFEKHINAIELLIDKLTGNLKNHIRDVFEKAKINKASRIYEHGISMEKTARLLGISIFDLADYAGKTGIPDIDLNKTLPVEKRIKYAMEIFA